MKYLLSSILLLFLLGCQSNENNTNSEFTEDETHEPEIIIGDYFFDFDSLDYYSTNISEIRCFEY